ncbi:PTS lactose/cellobiose transporter subunit IIA [Sporosalibacterium faouarense]|uniref:PTS lactose/cellobiose transporter subunit IIA n=1 Tax=Sporosalibacterium faouarense TaxID=516123 RepID=UPI00192B4D6F|nr:PTS lactose/cellobiose transporter subunit IIA [Sporosalibacterium faouarense]
MEFESIVLNIITKSGSARSSAMEAIQYAKNNESEKAKESIRAAEENIALAHKEQTMLIQEESKGKKVEVSLLLVHAQDHLMNAITLKDLAQEFVNIYNKISE